MLLESERLYESLSLRNYEVQIWFKNGLDFFLIEYFRQENIREIHEKFREAFGNSPDKKRSKVQKKKANKSKEDALPTRKSTRIPKQDKHPSYFEQKERSSTIKLKDKTSNVKIKVSDSSVKNFACEICKTTFKYNNSLTKHIKDKHKNVLYTCEDCLSSFSYLANLKRHMDTEHSRSIIKFHCNDCSQCFTYKHNLKVHVAKFHSREM